LRRSIACPNLFEWRHIPLTWDVQLFSYRFSRNVAFCQDYIMKLINNRQGGQRFVSSRTERIIGGKINTHYRSSICRQTQKAHKKESVEPFPVVLIKHKLVLPDDGPCGSKHVELILIYSSF
jgi:hypothetical protein